MTTLQKITQNPVTLRDMVQDQLRDAIIDGRFKPGQRLVERPLCEQLGVSRTVVRETIRYLEAEGLVEILPGRGPIVSRMTWDDARQIYDIRRMLESAAARACALALTPEIARRLSAAFDTLETAFGDDTPGALFRASTGFYTEIFQGAGHHIALEVVQRLNGRISRLRMMTLTETHRARPGLDHMRAIRDAILSGNAEAAAAAVTAHLDDTTAIAAKLLSQDPNEGSDHAET